jgi:iron complex outermembrane recepter protein
LLDISNNIILPVKYLFRHMAILNRLIFCFCVLGPFVQISAQSSTIRGRITSPSGPVAYASIEILPVKTGTTSNKSGEYELKNIPSGSYVLNVSCIGYDPASVSVELQSGHNAIMENIELKPQKGALNEIVVTGVSKATMIREDPLPTELVTSREIENTSAENVIDAIAKNAPGFETVKTGPNVSKPFINGLGYNRVLTLYDGLRVETQQWGDEHGVPMDDYLIGKAEVIKGPASIMYGSDAIAGVLSLFPLIPDDTDNILHVRWMSEYQSNNGLIGNNLMLYKGSSHLTWDISASERVAKNFKDPVDGRVYNTNFQMTNASGYLGYHTSKGFTHLNLTYYNNRQGIPDGSRDSLTRRFTYQVYETPGENSLQTNVDNIKNRPVVPENLLNSYRISPLSQLIQDYRLYSNNRYQIGRGDINGLVGFEQNIRREFDHPTDTKQAGLYVLLNTLDYSFRYDGPVIFGIQPSIGINGMYQANTNKDATDFPIPDYHLFDAGAFIYAQWKSQRWTIAGGLRYDHRNESGPAMYIKPDAAGFYRQVPYTDSIGAQKQFSSFSPSFQGMTGSIGATYRINDNLSIKGNIGKGYRAPNITELTSNGLDPGAHIVYIGDPGAQPEFSLQEDFGITGFFPGISFDVSGFNNYLRHYLYEEQKVDANGNPVVVVPGNKTFQYTQSNALLHGINASLNLHPAWLNNFYFNNSFSMVYGDNLNPKYKNMGVMGEYLPFIPSPEWISSIGYRVPVNSSTIPSLDLKVTIDYNASQNRYLGLYHTETATPSYTLVDASAGTTLHLTRNHAIRILATVENLLNKAYQSSLSRLKYFEYYTASPNGHLGIYNMGRNITLKIIAGF